MLLNVALFLLSVVVSKNHLFLVDDLVLSFFWGLLKPGLSPWLKKSQFFLQSLYIDLETHPRYVFKRAHSSRYKFNKRKVPYTSCTFYLDGHGK